MIHVDESDPVGEVAPPFAYKDVTIKRNTDVKDYYEMLSEIGRGKFGTVYHCRENETGLELAAKLVVVNRRDERRTVEREVDVMRKLRHPRLIQLYDAYDSGKVMCVVLELITGGELFERVIDDDFILTEKACTVFMRQICEGIEFVHQQNILHLDMKPENILCLTKTGNRIKIIDFGLARFFDPEKKLQILFGTPEFVAPEVVNFDQIGYGTDMWSIGVICYVLLSGLSPFMGETDIETMANVTIAKYDFDDEAFNEISEEAKDFITKLLIKDKQSRLSASECLRHGWLQRRPAPCPAPLPAPRPAPAPRELLKHELDVTKENLRLFVERWSEHPNSPYVFDVVTHEITACLANGADDSRSERSVGACSPSPRSSLASSPELVLEEGETDTPFVAREAFLGIRHNPVERRASDSSCFLHRKADVCLRVNLAEEIKKLSDHLYMLSTMNTDLANNNSAAETDKNLPVPAVNAKIDKKTTENVSTSNGIAEIKKPEKTKKTKAKVEVETKLETENKTMNGYRTNPRVSPLTNGFATAGERGLLTSKSSNKLNSAFLSERKPAPPVTSRVPWAKAPRTKFRVTNMSRDVPEQAPDRRNSFFGEEFGRRRDRIDKLTNGDAGGGPTEPPVLGARRTKDMLMRLLERWEGAEGGAAAGEGAAEADGARTGRQRSVSMQWAEDERVTRGSMSSLHAFFQRQVAGDGSPPAPAAVPSPLAHSPNPVRPAPPSHPAPAPPVATAK